MCSLVRIVFSYEAVRVTSFVFPVPASLTNRETFTLVRVDLGEYFSWNWSAFKMTGISKAPSGSSFRNAEPVFPIGNETKGSEQYPFFGP